MDPIRNQGGLMPICRPSSLPRLLRIVALSDILSSVRLLTLWTAPASEPPRVFFRIYQIIPFQSLSISTS